MEIKRPVKYALFGAGTRGELDLGYFIEKNKKKIQYVALAERDPQKRAFFMKRFKIPEKNAFEDWKDLLSKPKIADAIINALPCNLHYESTVSALKEGYDVLLEKPMAHNAGECINLVHAAKKYKRKLSIAFENRYNKIYQKVKQYLDQEAIGRLMDISCSENIGYFHFILSYVRGIHSQSTGGNSFMIAKGIHDIDLFTWFIQSKAKYVSSFGYLSYFNQDNAPPGTPQRCIEDCPIQEDCIFDALKQYYKPGHMNMPLSLALSQSLKDLVDIIRYPRFRTLASTISQDLTKKKILELLKQNTHGKCVFHSNNDVTDHQTTSIVFENDVTCSFSLSAFSLVWERVCDLHGTEGEIMSKDFSGRLEIRKFNPAKVKKERIRYRGLHHGGGDEFLLLDFAQAVQNDDPEQKSLTDIENCLEPHLIALAIEEARQNNKVIDMRDFRNRAEEEAQKLRNKNEF